MTQNQSSVRGQLSNYRQALESIEPSRANWGKVEAWVASVRPFLRRNFGDDLSDFERLTERPNWRWLTGASPQSNRITPRCPLC
jgi:hypothetical protein